MFVIALGKLSKSSVTRKSYPNILEPIDQLLNRKRSPDNLQNTNSTSEYPLKSQI